MSEDNKTEENPKTYSKAFENFERTRFTDKGSNLFFNLLDAMAEDFREEQAEKYRKLFQAVDIIDGSLKEVSSTEEGREAIKREISKRLSGNVK